MIISNKYIIKERDTGNVYCGQNPENQAVFRPLDCESRTYNTKLGANRALDRITESGFEMAVDVDFIEMQEVPDKAPDKPVKGREMYEDWEVVMPKFGRVRYLRKTENGIERLAMTDRNGVLQELGSYDPAETNCAVERQAWRLYIDELYKTGDDRIVSRSKGRGNG